MMTDSDILIGSGILTVASKETVFSSL